jgi:glycosyltransferase involved in cell wall biosynthesis
MTLKLCIFPTDPIIKYFQKGEIKDRYFNPLNIFDEIHIISLTERDIEESKVQTLVGNAKLKIYSVGNCSIINRHKKLKEILQLVNSINPDVIRTFNSLLPGWFAANCSKNLKIPLFVSLHTQYDYSRKIIKGKNFKKYLALKFSEKFIESFVIKNANKITMVYGIIEPYVKKYNKNKPEILPNRINCEQFSTEEKIMMKTKSSIISVGRLIEPKNHQCLIRAMKEIDSHLLIIGDGPLFTELNNLIKSLDLEKKVSIKKAVSNDKIQNYYKSATIFALSHDTELEDLPIPILEAMATGLPIVIPFPKNEKSLNLENIVIFSERNPKSFAKNIKMILDNDELKRNLSQKSLKKSKEFDYKIVEKREAEIYQELIE